MTDTPNTPTYEEMTTRIEAALQKIETAMSDGFADAKAVAVGAKAEIVAVTSKIATVITDVKTGIDRIETAGQTAVADARGFWSKLFGRGAN